MAGRKIADGLLPSIGDVLFLSIFLRTLYLGGQLLNDGDTGWHIAVGGEILKSFKVPVSDCFSHTAPGAPWTDHAWLSDVMFSAAHKLMGMNGVVLLSAFVISLTFFLLYKYMLIRGVNPLTAAMFTIIAVPASSGHWLARPHIFSVLLALAFSAILELYQRDVKNHLKFLPLLMVLWVNLHGEFSFGLILIMIYAVGNLAVMLTKNERRDEAGKKAKALGLVALATAAACFVNPRGPAVFVVTAKLVGEPMIINSLKEWSYPDFHVEKAFEFMLMAYIAVFVLSRKRPDIFEGATALLLTHMSLYSVRFAPLMAVVVTPLAAIRVGDALDSITAYIAAGRLRDYFERLSSRITILEGRFKGHVWVYAAVTACLIVALNGGKAFGTRIMDYGYDKGAFPVDALEFAGRNGITGNMFNNYNWGGYIIYAGAPRYKVFIDGRFEPAPYGVPLFKDYLRVERAEPGYERVLDKYKVDWVIYNANSAINQVLVAGGGWKLVYADRTADVILRDVPSNRDLIARYGDTKFVE